MAVKCLWKWSIRTTLPPANTLIIKCLKRMRTAGIIYPFIILSNPHDFCSVRQFNYQYPMRFDITVTQLTGCSSIYQLPLCIINSILQSCIRPSVWQDLRLLEMKCWSPASQLNFLPTHFRQTLHWIVLIGSNKEAISIDCRDPLVTKENSLYSVWLKLSWSSVLKSDGYLSATSQFLGC